MVTVDDPALNVTTLPLHVPPTIAGVPTSPAEAVPPVITETARVPAVEPVRVRVITTGVPLSVPLVAATVTVGTVGATSSSMIVTTPSPSLITAAPETFDNVTENVSSPSTSVSPTTATVIDLLLSPTRNVTVPDAATKSPVLNAEPGPVAHCTVVSSVATPSSEISTRDGVDPELPSVMVASPIETCGAVGLYSLKFETLVRTRTSSKVAEARR